MLKRYEEKGRLGKHTALDVINKYLTAQIDYNGFNNVDLVIEAVIEDIPLKQKVFFFCVCFLLFCCLFFVRGFCCFDTKSDICVVFFFAILKI